MAAPNVQQLVRHGSFAVVMGVVAALASVTLCLCVQLAYDTCKAHPWLLFMLPVLTVASLVIYQLCKLPLNTTTPTVINNIRANKRISPWLAPAILLGTCLSILGGASVGKESGALHMGASLGNLVGRPFKLAPIVNTSLPSSNTSPGRVHTFFKKYLGSYAERFYDDADDQQTGEANAYAASLGMAATFSALFFAPLGAAFFVFELARYKKQVVQHIITVLLACFIAYFVASAIGIGDIIPKVNIPAISWPVVGQCLVIAVVCAVGGTLYVRAIDGLQHLSERLSTNYYMWVVIASLLIAGLTLMFGWQNYEGTGGNQLAFALAGTQDVWGFAIKALVTVLALGLWVKGGEIMPTFTIGALLGASSIVLTGGDAGFSAAVGLVAFFAAMSRCPLAAFFLGCEIFGWAMAPYFALVVAIALSLGKGVGFYFNRLHA